MWGACWLVQAPIQWNKRSNQTAWKTRSSGLFPPAKYRRRTTKWAWNFRPTAIKCRKKWTWISTREEWYWRRRFTANEPSLFGVPKICTSSRRSIWRGASRWIWTRRRRDSIFTNSSSRCERTIPTASCRRTRRTSCIRSSWYSPNCRWNKPNYFSYRNIQGAAKERTKWLLCNTNSGSYLYKFNVYRWLLVFQLKWAPKNEQHYSNMG